MTLRRTLAVFEHQTLRVGETAPTMEGGSGSLSEAQFDALARFNDLNEQRYFRLGYRSVTFQSYVGYLQVGRLGIEILPKADRGAARAEDGSRWQSLLLEMLRVAAGLRLYSPSAAFQQLGRSTLLELVALRFVEEVERLLHEGLAKGYRSVEQNGSAFRGRLLVADNLRENIARADRFYVRFSAFDRDVLVNRILGAALDALGDFALGPSVRARLDACSLAFPEIGRPPLRSDLFDRLVLGRSTARYRDALVLARMILERHAPQLRAGRTPVFALLFDMNVLWERYVAWVFRRAASTDLEVATQESRRFWRSRPSPARTVRPDLVVRDRRTGQRVLVADTKWKVLAGGAPADDDLKQMFVYNELFGTARSLLVYPAAGEGAQRLDGEYVERSHGCGTVELGLFEGTKVGSEALVEQVRRVLATVGPGAVAQGA